MRAEFFTSSSVWLPRPTVCSSRSSRPRFSLGDLPRRPGVVQRDAHGGMGDGRDEHLVEPPERVAVQELAVVGAIGEDAGVVEGHVEVVLPELGHHLQHLPLGVDAAQQAPTGVVLHRLPAPLGLGLVALPDGGGVEVDRGPPRLERTRLRVGDGGGVQLGLEPGLGAAGGRHLLMEAGREAVGEPVRQVQRGRGRQRRGDRLGRFDGRGDRRVDGRIDGWGRRCLRRRRGLVVAVPAPVQVAAGVVRVPLAPVEVLAPASVRARDGLGRVHRKQWRDRDGSQPSRQPTPQSAPGHRAFWCGVGSRRPHWCLCHEDSRA